MAAVAMMEPPVANGDAAPFPLECLLCPKKPTFSDVSHLLTHISSKAHLHQKFSTEFKAKSDMAAKDRLEKFDTWYSAHKIEYLLSERIAAKGVRKPARRNRTSTPGAKSRKSASAVDALRADADAASGYQTPNGFPRLAHWNTAPAGNGNAMDYASLPYYHSPLALRQQRSAYPLPDEVGGNGTGMRHGHYGVGMDAAHSTGPPSEFDSTFGADDESQASKLLKGIVWPGMDMFDSATPDQKKIRNQRKGSAAVDLLKLTSENVNAIETVWGPAGDMRKERDIYASPSIDGTPPSTPPRRRKQRARNGAASNQTPLSLMKAEDGQDDQIMTKRVGRLAAADLASDRQSSVPVKAVEKRSKKKKSGPSGTTEEVDDPVYALSNHNEKGAFNVFYESGSNGGGVGPQTGLADGAHDNGYDQSGLQGRPALQQLDPNLAISESSPYFKHSTSTRFFDNGAADHSQAQFRSQASPYGNGFAGVGGSSLNSLSAQPRSNGIYPPFDSQIFGGMGNGDSHAVPFNAPGNRRVGFGGFGIDPNSSPFGYNDQREGGMRDASFSDPTFQSTTRLFEL